MRETVIVRHSNERTATECVRRVEKDGYIMQEVTDRPFPKAVLHTLLVAQDLAQEFVAVIDGDVLIDPGMIKRGIQRIRQSENAFCLDGFTRDKIFIMTRRAGVHIYRTGLCKQALNHVPANHIKPESAMRKAMKDRGFKTIVDKRIVFGSHDYEQYYRDLYRKAYIQALKLPGHVKAAMPKWKRREAHDADYAVIFAGARAGGLHRGDRPVVDANVDYGAHEAIKRLGLTEKAAL